MAILASAQSTRVRGAVRDAETGEPIPFASVYFDGTVIGISTDLEGRYSLETRSDEITTLTAHLIGYEAQTKQIAKGSFSEVDFVLKKDLRQLEAALVKPDNRYIRSILDRLDKARKRHDPEIAEAVIKAVRGVDEKRIGDIHQPGQREAAHRAAQDGTAEFFPDLLQGRGVRYPYLRQL